MRWTAVKWLLAFCAIGAAGLYAYETGSRLAESKLSSLQGQIVTLNAKIAELERTNADRQAAILAERQRLEALQQRLNRDLPAGEAKELLDLIQGKITAGVSVDRLKSVIAAAENRRECTALAENKRFMVQTPVQRGVNSTVTFDGGAITLTASGTSARDGAGNPEAWFDLNEPVTLRLTQRGGRTSEVVGKLPLFPSMVVGDREYRLAVIAGPRGLVQASGERCRYP
jgi:hypothetical protein